MTALTRDEIRADVAQALFAEPDEIGDDADLVAEGLDSVRMMALLEQWRTRGLEATFSQLMKVPTVRAWADLVAAGDES